MGDALVLDAHWGLRSQQFLDEQVCKRCDVGDHCLRLHHGMLLGHAGDNESQTSVVGSVVESSEAELSCHFFQNPWCKHHDGVVSSGDRLSKSSLRRPGLVHVWVNQKSRSIADRFRKANTIRALLWNLDGRADTRCS